MYISHCIDSYILLCNEQGLKIPRTCRNVSTYNFKLIEGSMKIETYICTETNRRCAANIFAKLHSSCGVMKCTTIVYLSLNVRRK